jgi:glutamate-1-semialdehyde 2,1-aminomutase
MIDDTLVIAPGQAAALEQVFAEHGQDIAAVIVEPVMANNGLFEYDSGYFELLRKITKQNSSLLIFDEVITGFRVAWGGAASHYGIEPDIGTYGKIIGGGMPVGAVAAKKSIMESLAPLGKVYQAGTLSGNPLAMVAGIAQLSSMKRENFYQKVEVLGQYLDKKVNQLKSQRPEKPFGYRRVAGIFWFCLGQEKLPRWPQEIPASAKALYAEAFHSLLRKGVYTAPSAYEVGFLSQAHTESDIDKLIEAMSQI